MATLSRRAENWTAQWIPSKGRWYVSSGAAQSRQWSVTFAGGKPYIVNENLSPIKPSGELGQLILKAIDRAVGRVAIDPDDARMRVVRYDPHLGVYTVRAGRAGRSQQWAVYLREGGDVIYGIPGGVIPSRDVMLAVRDTVRRFEKANGGRRNQEYQAGQWLGSSGTDTN